MSSVAKQSLNNPSSTGARLDRSINQVGKLIDKSHLLAQSAGREREEGDIFGSFNGKTPPASPNQKETDRQLVKELASKTEQRNQKLVAEANKNAAGILLKAILGLDPKLLGFTQKSTAEKSPEQAQAIVAKNIEALIKDPENVKTLQHVVAKLGEKLSSENNLKPGEESLSGLDPKTTELLTELHQVAESGSHQELQQLFEKLKTSNPQLLSQLKPLIRGYKNSLENVFNSERRNIANIEELKKHPLYNDGLEFRNDKSQRNFLAKLAGQILDARGGVYNYADTDVSWVLQTFEHKPGLDGKTVTDLEVRRLLPAEIAGNSRHYVAQLTEEQPTYKMMQKA